MALKDNLPRYVWMTRDGKDGDFVPTEQATVHVMTHALHYASSVFEGIRAYNTRRGTAVFRLKDHLRRLLDSAKIYRMDVPYTVDELAEITLELIRKNGHKACYIRPLIFRGFYELGVLPFNCPVEVAIMTWEWGRYLGEEAIEKGVDVMVSSWNRMRPNTMPAMAKATANYANGQLVKMEAHLYGFAEGIMLTSEGYVAEGSGENLFVIRDGVIYTPPLSQSILPGITRDSVVKLARHLGYEVVETAIPREMLYIADEVFFTGTAAEITPIRSIDKIPIGKGERGPITRHLQEEFFKIVNWEVEVPWEDWLTPVYGD